MKRNQMNPLKKTRIDAGGKIPSLSRETGIHPETIRRWERGESIPRIDNLWEVALLLNAEPVKLHDDMVRWKQRHNPDS